MGKHGSVQSIHKSHGGCLGRLATWQADSPKREAKRPRSFSNLVVCRNMFRRTDDLRITQVRPLIPPAILLEEIPISERASNVVSNTRAAIAERARAAAIPGWSSSSARARFTTRRRRSSTPSG